MTTFEALDCYRDEIKDALIQCTEDAMRSHGKVKFSIYCWEDDGVQVMEDVAGGNAELRNDDDDQELFLITTVDCGIGFRPKDWFIEEDIEDEEDDDDPTELDMDDEDMLIDRIIADTDWDAKLDEIEEEMYYEVARA